MCLASGGDCVQRRWHQPFVTLAYLNHGDGTCSAVSNFGSTLNYNYFSSCANFFSSSSALRCRSFT